MPTDHKFTGQQLDATGLYYYNARYYDPQLGTFLSPDTIVPDPTVLIDYNRYSYARGNPLKYNDPTGHYSDKEIMENYGCSNWTCVEALFEDGGAYAGLWGWLYTLQQAVDGDTVTATTMSIQESGASINHSMVGMFQRTQAGQINVHLNSFIDPTGVSTIGGIVSENGFAHFAASGAYGLYELSGQNANFGVGRDVQHNYLSVEPITALKAGATVGPLITKGAPATGPLAPYVAGVGEVYTALGWGTKIADDYVTPFVKGQWRALGTNLVSDGIGFGLSSYGGRTGEGLAVGMDAAGLSSGVCYGTGCRR